jgi:predicted nucleic acid-binding protein/DNA-directed RNA polymerase subunit RPC12/RpoP
MSKFHNVLDASTLAKKYRQETGWQIIQSLFRKSDKKECTLHILNVTIPEIVGAFVRWELKGEIGKGQWKELKNLFIEDIKNYRVVIHNITDRNIIRTDDVWEKSMPIKATQSQGEEKIKCPHCDKEIITYKRKPRVGPIDVMVLSVGLELKLIYGHGNVYLFTSDNHMLKVADRLKIKTCNPEAVTEMPF